MPGTLFLVATPIGNLGDMSFRGVEILKTADLIACEDTRHTRKLLNHFGISNKLVSYHEHNEAERSAEFAALLTEGTNIALVSDAGTPGINDPGYKVTLAALECGANVVPIPGPAAFVSAAIISGLPTDSLYFGGFLPSKKGDRRRRLEEVISVPGTLIFYEAPHRVGASLADCHEVLGDRQAAVAREITKLHEEVVRGPLSELKKHFSAANSRGEFVLVIDRVKNGDVGPKQAGSSLTGRIAELENEGLEHKAALKKAAKEFGISRSEAYREWQSQKERG
ncbi:MAG: 16S rRNA (cytidine(1402)-2'-O)-methyltransferase [Pyrinomonadaceae bacterium]|nr:16S rRNA (cytidine(1402)-2'-O)-methyltransferase [Pyrinomonadaceae bacterium]